MREFHTWICMYFDQPHFPIPRSTTSSLSPQLFYPSNFMCSILIKIIKINHRVQETLPVCAWVQDHLLERGQPAPQSICFWRKPRLPPHNSHELPTAPWLGMGLCEPLPAVGWDPGWLDLVQVFCIQSQQLWVPVSNNTHDSCFSTAGCCSGF